MNPACDFLKEGAALQPDLVAWRRDLHQMPETGTSIPKTTAYIRHQLTQLGIACTVHEDISCVEATIGTGSPCFLLRSDMDAIPGTEEADVPFRAEGNAMHGCGHDLHAAILLGAAKLLKAHEAQLPGTVKLLFQSGEEVFQGAKAAIDAGILENPDVDAALAIHVIAMMPLGLVMTGKEAMASVDGFQITLTGRGGHGSMPEICIDPINAAVQVYLALQSLIARETGGTEEAVLTIGQFRAGEAANVIPERAVLQGTLRTFKPEVRQRLVRRIREISTAVAAAYRCGCEYEVLSACPSVICDDAVTALARDTLRALLPRFHLMDGAHGMGSEDFAEIAQRVPAAYLMLGAGPADEKRRFGQHNPRIEFNEDVLSLGAAIYAQTALNYLTAHKE